MVGIIIGVVLASGLLLFAALWIIDDVMERKRIKAALKEEAPSYQSRRREAECRLKFDQFVKWYEINPDDWILHHDGYADYVVKKSLGEKKGSMDEATFWFEEEDEKKYVRWFEDRRIADFRKKESARMADLLESVKNDIETFIKKDSSAAKEEEVQTVSSPSTEVEATSTSSSTNPYQLYYTDGEVYTVLGGGLVLLTPLNTSKNPEYTDILEKIKAHESYDRAREEKARCSML